MCHVESQFEYPVFDREQYFPITNIYAFCMYVQRVCRLISFSAIVYSSVKPVFMNRFSLPAFV